VHILLTIITFGLLLVSCLQVSKQPLDLFSSQRKIMDLSLILLFSLYQGPDQDCPFTAVIIRYLSFELSHDLFN
jgi:hypothetical protein